MSNTLDDGNDDDDDDSDDDDDDDDDDEQEVQLPLRNRAPAMHFFVAKLLSIAVMIYTYVYHLRNLRPMIIGLHFCP